jgi:hypothetical protein
MFIHQLLGGVILKIMMIESPEWSRITAYAAENRIKMAIEAIESREDMAFEATDDIQHELATSVNALNTGNNQRLDCIYDDEPLGFEKDPISSNQRMQAQDPLQEIDIGDGPIKRPTYISNKLT